MKRKGVNQKTIAKYLGAFNELKHEIDSNPKTRNGSFIATKHEIGKQSITMLKKAGVVHVNKKGMFWVGDNPSVRMVAQITEMIHQYHVDLKNRKKTDGDLFKRNHPKRIKHSEVIKKPIEERTIGEVDKTDLDEWRAKYQSQKAEKTDVPIKQPAPDSSMVSEFIEYDVPVKTRIFEFRIFGIKLFTIKY